MSHFINEVDQNFDAFFDALPKNVASTSNSLSSAKERFSQSYRRIISLNAWRGILLEQLIESTAEAFFKEAQNDAIMSHALARQGAWRVALMCLRSCIENTLSGLYYHEHPVELRQWHSGNHKLGFSELISYIVKHPSILDIGEQQSGVETLKSEYSTLSKAVHGSSQSFRMTKSGVVQGLNIASIPDLGAWLTREKQTLAGINLLLTTFFRSHLSGAAHLNLRKAIGLAIPVSQHEAIKLNLGVKLRT